MSVARSNASLSTALGSGKSSTLATGGRFSGVALLGLPAAELTVAVYVRVCPYTLGFVPVVRATAVDVVRRARNVFPVDEAPAARVTAMGFVALVSAIQVGTV